MESLKSGKNKLDQNMYDAFISKKFVNINYQLKDYHLITSTQTLVNFFIEAYGTLEIAGVQKDIALLLRGKNQTKNETYLTGETSLKMTDFKIKPPDFFLGTLKTYNDIQKRNNK